jgi:hypothetical protein
MVLHEAPGMAQQGNSVRNAGRTTHALASGCFSLPDIHLTLVNGSTDNASPSNGQANVVSKATIRFAPGFGNKLHRITGCLLAVLLFSVSSSVLATEVQSTEYRVKRAFLHNFSRFVTWPETALQYHTEFSLCVIGADPFGTQLDKLTGKVVHNKPLVVKHLNSLALPDNCHLVFVGKDADVAEILLLLGEKPVLTVSETAEFIEQGGMIQFVLVDNKVRFKINVSAATNAGLNISSKLLPLAVSIRQGH